MKIDRDLLQKYNVAIPRYTSYPPANFFGVLSDNEKVVDAIKKSNELEPQNISFYIHIPFCSQLCFYCACNTHITKNQQVIDDYMDHLEKEIKLYTSLIDKKRKVSQIHWGGGTPNYLPIEQIQRIMRIFKSEFEFIEEPEIAIECHPAHLDFEYVDGLKQAGFNRISLGIQDIHNEVLDLVHRALPKLDLQEIISYIEKSGFSLNLDFIYGLPGQTIDSFRENMQKAIEFSPDRLAIFSYAHVPWIKPHQKYLERYHLPSAEEKIQFFETAYEMLTSAGYISIGLDHFAKPDDELSIALKNKTLHRNFQGYCTRRTTGQVYAFGVSAISQLATGYFQNTKDLKKYAQSLDNNILPFEKGYFTNAQEKIIGEIITEIMCNRYIDFDEFAQKHQITVKEIFDLTKVDFNALKTFETEGLLRFSDNKLEIGQKGMFFLRNIAASFDPALKNSHKKFSKSI